LFSRAFAVNLSSLGSLNSSLYNLDGALRYHNSLTWSRLQPYASGSEADKFLTEENKS
jgi:hypothetical protein